MFQKRFSSFPESVQDFLRECEASNIGTHIKDVDVNSRCRSDDSTVLMMVCMYSHAYNPLQYSYYIPHAVEKVKWLLSKGADPNKQDDDGYTALMSSAACSSKSIKIYKGKCFMKKFKDYKICPVEQKINRNLSLMIVKYFDRDDDIKYKSSENIVKILLNNGADPNVQNTYGDTALIMAAYDAASEKIVEILLKCGADPNIQDDDGCTALVLTNIPSVKRLIQKYL